MTRAEDELLDRLSGQSKLTLVWQLLAAFTTWLLTDQYHLFWIPLSCALLGAAMSGAEILWILPHTRRRIWNLGNATPTTPKPQ